MNSWIDRYLAYTNNTEPSKLFREWCAISAIAACLQRKCFSRWDTDIYPNMYIVLVGPPASRKGTAMAPILSLLKNVGIELAANCTTRQAIIKNMRDITTGTITEGEKISLKPHASLTVFSTELDVFLGAKNDELMKNMIDWFDCHDEWVYDTISRGKESITGVFVNLLGATTPISLAENLPNNSVGTGLSSRMIFVFSRRKGKSVPDPRRSKREEEIEKGLQQDLFRILQISGEFQFSDDYIEKYTEWYVKNDTYTPIHLRDSRLQYYVQRRSLHLRKLSMIVSAAKNSDKIITARDFDEALLRLTNVEKSMYNVFGGMGRSEIAGLVHSVRYFILSQPNKRCTMHQLMQQFHPDADAQVMSRVLATLEKMGVDRVVIDQEGSSYIQGLE